MIHCSRCGHRNNAGASRCGRCGHRIELSPRQSKLVAIIILAAVAAWHLHQDDAIGYSVFAASVTTGGCAVFYLAYRRDPHSMIPEVAAKTWKGAGAIAGLIVGVMFAFLPLAGAIAMGLILPPLTIGLIRLSDRVGLRFSGPFAMRCRSCSAPVAIRAHYCPFCGFNLKVQAKGRPTSQATFGNTGVSEDSYAGGSFHASQCGRGTGSTAAGLSRALPCDVIGWGNVICQTPQRLVFGFEYSLDPRRSADLPDQPSSRIIGRDDEGVSTIRWFCLPVRDHS